MTTNRETSFKTVSYFIDLGYFQLICQMLAKFSGVKSERTVFKFRKNNKKICCVHLVYKVNAWNWEVSRRSRATSAKKCTKKRDARAKFLLCYLNLLLFCRSRCRRRRRCLSSILFWSKNCATMVTWRHTSLYSAIPLVNPTTTYTTRQWVNQIWLLSGKFILMYDLSKKCNKEVAFEITFFFVS